LVALVIDQALRLARLWRRLAEARSWAPLADAAAVRETLQFLGCGGGFSAADIYEWLTSIGLREQGPPLISHRAGARVAPLVRVGRLASLAAPWTGTIGKH
jgi:hypothetical protein